MADIETTLSRAVEAGDPQLVLAAVEEVDWRGTASGAANRMLQRVALYGYSGRTQRYQESIRAMLARGCAPNLASCALICDNDRGRHLLATTPGAITQVDADGATALHHAAERGNAELAAALCTRGADVDARDHRGATPLDRALHAGPWKAEPATDVVALLREHGATVDFWTLAALGDVSGLRAALAEAPAHLDQHDGQGRTALFHAARNNRRDAVAALLAAGAEPNRACADGQTALSTACLHMLSQECDIDIVRALVAQGADMTLPAAIVSEDLEAVRAFVAREPAALAGQDHDSALGYAIHAWRPRALACLIDAGAMPDAANWGHIERIAGDDVAFVQHLKRCATERMSR